MTAAFELTFQDVSLGVVSSCQYRQTCFVASPQATPTTAKHRVLFPNTKNECKCPTPSPVPCFPTFFFSCLYVGCAHTCRRCVAVGVPAKVLGQGKKRKPALAMDQDCFKEVWGGKDI